MTNPFIEREKKRTERIQRQYSIARCNYEALRDLLERFTDADRPETRKRVRMRVQEARTVLEGIQASPTP